MPVIFLAMTQRLPSKKKNHDRVLKAYQAAYAKCEKDRMKLFDWIQQQHEAKELPNQDFKNTNHTFKLHNWMHQNESLMVPSEPTFSDFYQPSSLQKQGTLMFVDTGALVIGYAAFRFLFATHFC